MDARPDIHELINAARRGVPDALGMLFEAARGHLIQVADRELPADVRARVGPSDVVQETAVEMRRDFVHFTGTTTEALFAWLRGILENNVVDTVRHHRDVLKRDMTREVSLATPAGRRAGEAVPDLARGPDGSAIRREEAAALGVVLHRLPVEFRLVLQLRYWHGLSFVEMAPRLRRSPEAVRKLWFRAVRHLQVELRAPANHDEPVSPPILVQD